MISFHNPDDTFELKFAPIPRHDLARVIDVDDWPFPPEPAHKRARGSWVGQQPRLEHPPIRPRHKARSMTATDRAVVIGLLVTCALALVALMIVALAAGRAPAARPLPTGPTSSSWPVPIPPAGPVGSPLPSPSPAPTI